MNKLQKQAWTIFIFTLIATYSIVWIVAIPDPDIQWMLVFWTSHTREILMCYLICRILTNNYFYKQFFVALYIIYIISFKYIASYSDNAFGDLNDDFIIKIQAVILALGLLLFLGTTDGKARKRIK